MNLRPHTFQTLAIILATSWTIITGAPSAMANETQKATFAGGCFWCMEHPFEKLDGVISVVAGYIRKYASGPLKQALENQKDSVDVVFMDYDWSLNTAGE